MNVLIDKQHDTTIKNLNFIDEVLRYELAEMRVYNNRRLSQLAGAVALVNASGIDDKGLTDEEFDLLIVASYLSRALAALPNVKHKKAVA
jgi:hypothetical protein